MAVKYEVLANYSELVIIPATHPLKDVEKEKFEKQGFEEIKGVVIYPDDCVGGQTSTAWMLHNSFAGILMGRVPQKPKKEAKSEIEEAEAVAELSKIKTSAKSKKGGKK